MAILTKKAAISRAQKGYFCLGEVETSVQQVTWPIRPFIQLDAGDECEVEHPIM
jgi:hypothetical protein